MAEGKASLLIELKDNVSEGLKKVNSSVAEFATTILAAAAAGAGLVAFLTESLIEYGKQEDAIARLNVALRNAGIAGDDFAGTLIKQAEELQKTTGFADDAIISAQALGSSFGFTGKQLQEITIRALDLAAFRTIDLNSAMLMLGKSIETGTGTALRRFGVIVDDNILKSHDFNAIMGALDANFKGTAETLNNTTSGSFKQFHLAVEDLMKAVGEFVSGPATTFLGWLTNATRGITDLIKAMGPSNQVMKETAGLTKAQTEEYISLGRAINDLVALAKAESRDLNPIEAERLVALVKRKKAIEDLAKAQQDTDNKMKVQESLEAKQRLAAVDKETATLMGKMQTRGNQKIALAALFGRQDADLLAKGLSEEENQKLITQVRELDALGKFHDSEMLQEQAVEFARQKLEKQRIENLSSTLNFISSLSTAKNKELAVIGKAAAIGTATVDTYQAANKALASAPPPWNFALAAAVVAAGFVNVAKIGGVQLAEGGIVMPRSGGTMATIGEAGSAEAVIPLDDPRAMAMMGGGGGGTHVHFHGPFMGDAVTAKRFAQMIDKHLFNLKRNGQSVSA